MSFEIFSEGAVNVSIAHRAKMRQKRGRTKIVRLMCPDRWPVITTSVSGLSKDFWKEFKATADARGMTDREATEQAIRDLAAAVQAGEHITWEPSKRAPPHSVRAHEDRWKEVAALIDHSGYRQGVVIQTALRRWIDRG